MTERTEKTKETIKKQIDRIDAELAQRFQSDFDELQEKNAYELHYVLLLDDIIFAKHHRTMRLDWSRSL